MVILVDDVLLLEEQSDLDLTQHGEDHQSRTFDPYRKKIFTSNSTKTRLLENLLIQFNQKE